MGKNTGLNHRHGAVKNRTQVLNPITKQFVKRNSETGRFMDVKNDSKKFKGVTNEN